MLAYAILAIENESDREFMEDLYRRHYSLMYRKALSLRSYLLSRVKNAAIDRLRRDSNQFKRLCTFDDAPG